MLFSVFFFVLVPFLFYIRFPLVVVLFFAVLFFVVFGCFFRAFFRAFCGVFLCLLSCFFSCIFSFFFSYFFRVFFFRALGGTRDKQPQYFAFWPVLFSVLFLVVTTSEDRIYTIYIYIYMFFFFFWGGHGFMKSRFKRCQVVYGNADYNLCIYYKCNYVCKDFSFLTGDYIISIYYLYVYIYICIYFHVPGSWSPSTTHTHTTSTATTRSARAYDMPTIFKDLVEFHLRLEIMLCSKLHVKQQVT